MRRVTSQARRTAAAVPVLLFACLPACRPSDFDGLDRGASSVDLGPSDQAPDASAPLRDAQPEDAGSELSDALVAADARPPSFEDDAGLSDAGAIDAATRDAASSDAQMNMDAASDAQADAARDAESPDAARDASAPVDSAQPVVDAGPITVALPILADRDDALWRSAGGGLEEKLHFSPSDGAAGYTIEVGVDSEMCRLGLRFALPFGHGAQVVSAKLSIRRVGPATDTESNSTMAVRVFESDSVLPFDPAHTHDTPSGHDPGGIWLGSAVTGYAVGATEAWNESPNLAALVQHVVDRSAFRAGNYIGFVLSPDGMTGTQYAQFRDSYAGENPAVLTVTYRP